MNRLAKVILLASTLMLSACPLENIKRPNFPGKTPSGTTTGSGGGHVANVPAGVIQIDCGKGNTCRELTIQGDPESMLPNNTPAPFRGYADPSLRRDPDTNTLWLSYSWLNVALGPKKGSKPVVDFVIRTHLAKSTDNGRTFRFVKEINDNTKATHASNNKEGWLSHEVSTIAKDSSGQWQLMWITYLDPYGPPKHGPAQLSSTSARSPEDLGSNTKAFIRGAGSPPSGNVQYDLSKQSGLGDCMTFTEPSLFTYKGGDYLAVNCLIMQGRSRRADQEKMLLFKKVSGEYRYQGHLVDYKDASTFGGERLEQGELTVARDGTLLLIATPQKEGAQHYGCFIWEVESLDPPKMRRNPDGTLVTRGYITDSQSTERGPGACSYDPNSETGVLIVRRDFQLKAKPMKMRFSILETGFHP